MTEGDELRRSLERLVALGQTPDVNIRPVLLRVLVDLFVRKVHHAPADLLPFEAMVVALLAEADPETRLVVADKLARHPAPPPGLMARLMAEGGDVAGRVLEHAPLDLDTQLTGAALGPSDTAIAIARRADLGTLLCRQLAERPEPEVLLALVDNAAAPLDRPLFQYLVRRARGDDTLGAALLRRGAHPADLAPLFLLANSEQREAILPAARRDDLGPARPRPRLSPQETKALAQVERAVLSSEREGFDTSLASGLDIGLDQVWRIIDDPRGEPLALALAALGASAELAARIFILSGPAIGHSVMAVRRLTGLVETMPMATARRLVRTMAGGGERLPRRTAAPEDAAGRPRQGLEARPVARAAARPERRSVAGKPR